MAGLWWSTPLIPALGRQRQADFWVQGHPGLQREFQDSQGYTEKPCLGKKIFFCPGSCGVSQGVTQYTLLPTHLYLRMFIALSHWSVSKPLASATVSIPDPRGKPCCFPVSYRSSTPDRKLQDWPFHVPGDHNWNRCCGEEPTQSPGSGPGRELSESACQLAWIPTNRVFSPAPPWLAHPKLQSAKAGSALLLSVLTTSSPAHSPPGPALS